MEPKSITEMREAIAAFDERDSAVPRYSDGTAAKVGDQIFGTLDNSGPKAGVIISVTPNQESRNAKVQFCEALPIVDGLLPKPPRMCIGPGLNGYVRVYGEDNGTSGPEFLIFLCIDYCSTSELTKIG